MQHVRPPPHPASVLFFNKRLNQYGLTGLLFSIGNHGVGFCQINCGAVDFWRGITPVRGFHQLTCPLLYRFALMLRKDRTLDGGGVMLLIHKNNTHMPITELENNSESVWVKELTNTTSHFVASWYRQPGGD